MIAATRSASTAESPMGGDLSARSDRSNLPDELLAMVALSLPRSRNKIT
jgi:hypothetical protein